MLSSEGQCPLNRIPQQVHAGPNVEGITGLYSHSGMQCWNMLVTWVADAHVSCQIYLNVSDSL